MYAVFAEEIEEIEDAADAGGDTVQTLEQAFAQIACRCGLSYRFVAHEGGWGLELTDVANPDASPAPIYTDSSGMRTLNSIC